MFSHRVSALALLLLTACSEKDLRPVPVERGALLEPGRYDLLVREVVAAACDVDPGVARGQVVPVDLAIERGGVALVVGEWVLHGAMEPGNLHVEGPLGVAEPVPMDDEEPVYEDTGADSGGEDADDEVDPDERPDGEPPEGDPGEPRGDERPASALLDARIRAGDLAEGSLFVSLPGCEIELAVVIGRRAGAPEEPAGEDRPDEGGSSEEGDEGAPPREG